MKLHEYQAKALLAKYGVPVPRGEVASSLDEVRRIAKSYQGKCVVKVQIHAGGRGKSGGVKLVDTLDSAVAEAEKMLSGNIVTSQTTSDGVPVNELLIEEALDVIKELYLSILVDGGLGRVIVMASEAGGMEIEQVAEDTPEQILREVIDPNIGLMAYQARNLAIGLGLDRALHSQFIKLLSGAFNAFIQTDCSLIEINPLAVTAQGRLLAIDAKASIDDDALFRQKNELLDYANQQASEITGLKFIGTARQKASILSFTLDGIHPHDVGTILNSEGIAIRTGHHCAMPVMEYFKIPATSRASFTFYNTHEEIDALIKAIEKCKKVFN